MSARILDGRALAKELREGLAARAAALERRGITPRLVVVTAGEDEASRAYAAGLQKLGSLIGVEVAVDALPPDVAEESLRARLERYGHDRATHGVMLQQPLPRSLSIRRIADAVPARKDVDGTNPINLGRLAFSAGTPLAPATPAAVMLLLERSEKWPLKGRDVTVIGRSSVVGLPLGLLLIAHDATVTVTHRGTRDIRSHTREADIVVAAAGIPRLVDASWLQAGATVIDVGTTTVDGRLVGDVDFESASAVASELTPVPGGVGPVTNVALMRNLVAAAEALTGDAT
jgi:methylenetetrahydrofolate dehydrogenase (NADP+)/methenyltetrahydrofolate cyclohydrolase